MDFVAELDLLLALVLADDRKTAVGGAGHVPGVAEGGLAHTVDLDVDIAVVADVDVEVAVGGALGSFFHCNEVHSRLGFNALADVGIDSDAVLSGIRAALADLAVICTVAPDLGVTAEHFNHVGDFNSIDVGLGLLESEALGSVVSLLVAMVGFEAVLHFDLAVFGLAVNIFIVAIGNSHVRVLVLYSTGDGSLNE